MVPASSNLSGWCLFTKELDRFLSSSNTVWVEGKIVDVAVGGGSMEGGGQDGKKSFNFNNQQNLRNFEISRAVLGHNVLKGVSAVTVSSKNGRPTCEFKFEVTSANLALRVTKSVGGKRMVTRLNPYNPQLSNTSGPVLFKTVSGHGKAHLVEPSGKAQMEDYYLLGLGVGKSYYQSASVVGEYSRPPMESTVTSVLPEAPTAVISPVPSPDQVSEPLPSYPASVSHVPKTGKGLASRSGSIVDDFIAIKACSSMGSIFDAEVSTGLGVRPATASFESPMLKVVSPILGRYPWVTQNCFSPLSDLGNGVEDEFEEGEVQVEEQRVNSVDSGGGAQTESGLHILQWETRQAVDHSCDSGEKDVCVLE